MYANKATDLLGRKVKDQIIRMPFLDCFQSKK